ncbi:MAG: glycosyltransferase family 4 protein [Sporolactobacillus sp.]
MKTKRILMIGDSVYPDSMGGSHRHIYELAINLIKNGHEVFIITPKINESQLCYEEIDQIKIYRYDRNRNNRLLGILNYVINPYNLYKKLENKYHFDVIHGHWALSNFLIFKRSKNPNKIFTLHGPMFEEYSYELSINSLAKKCILFIMRQMEKSVLKNSRQILTASKYMSDKLHQLYGTFHNVSIIPVPTNTEKFQPMYENKKLAKNALHLKDELTLLTVRRLQKRMGIGNLIRAFELLAKALPNYKIKLLIGGKGPIKGELIDLINKLNLNAKVKLIGYIPEKELSLYYEATDLFVVPSLDLEGFGLVTTEAMAVGTNVVATPVGGNKEILQQYDSNLLTKSTNFEDIYNKLLEIISKNHEFAYDEKCRDFVVNNYSWSKNIKKFEHVYLV